MRGHVFEFSQAPAGMRSDSNEFWVVRVSGVVRFAQVVGEVRVWIVIRDHRLISFVNRDSENDIFLNDEVKMK